MMGTATPMAPATGATTSTVNSAATNNTTSSSVQVGSITVTGQGDPASSANAVEGTLNNLFGKAQQAQLTG
jgi:hypothetical protein